VTIKWNWNLTVYVDGFEIGIDAEPKVRVWLPQTYNVHQSLISGKGLTPIELHAVRFDNTELSQDAILSGK